MIHLKENFYNLVMQDIRESHKLELYSEKELKARHIVEGFNNGVLTYKVLINKLAKVLKIKNIEAHETIQKYVVSFGASYNPIFHK